MQESRPNPGNSEFARNVGVKTLDLCFSPTKIFCTKPFALLSPRWEGQRVIRMDITFPCHNEVKQQKCATDLDERTEFGIEQFRFSLVAFKLVYKWWHYVISYLVDSPEGADIDGLTPDGTGTSNTGGVLTRSGVDDGINQNLNGVLEKKYYIINMLSSG